MTTEEAVLLDSTLLALRKPSQRTYEAFQNVFNNAGSAGSRFPILGDANAHAYDDPDDLMSLRSLKDDRLTQILRDNLPVLFMVSTTLVATRLFPVVLTRFESDVSARIFATTNQPRAREHANIQQSKNNGPLADVSESRIQFLGGTITVVMTAVLLFGAISSLYYTASNEKRLGLIAGYTTGFALAVRFLTNARRAEIFGACAAYAAVLVVFISGNLSPPESSTSSN